MTDAELAALPIPARNALLDQLEYEAAEHQARLDAEAEAATERWFETRGGFGYAGSPEEQRDRWLESLAF